MENNLEIIYGARMIDEHYKIRLAKQKIAENSIAKIVSGHYDEKWATIEKMENSEQKNILTILFIKDFANACASICLINIPQAITQLNKKLLSEKELQWIIPNDEFNRLLEKIGEKYLVVKPMVFEYVEFYLTGRLYVSIIEKFRLELKESKSQSYYEFALSSINNVERRTTKKETIDFLWNDLKNSYTEVIKNIFECKNGFISFLNHVNSGKWNDILIPMYYNCFIKYEAACLKTPKSIKMKALYHLYARILNEEKWSDEIYLTGEMKGQEDSLTYVKRMRKYLTKK